MDTLTFTSVPEVTLATNRFINVPIILQYDDTPLISVIRNEDLSFSTEIPIYHQDGTYLAKVNGTRVFETEDGSKAGIKMSYPKGMTVCEMDGKTLFEIRHERGDAFRTHAELYTPDGYFVKCSDTPSPRLVSNSGKALQIGGVVMSGNTFNGCRIGVWIKSNGSVSMGCS
jgi:hypothetical protein